MEEAINQEAKNSYSVPLQEEFHREISKDVKNMCFSNNGMKFLRGRTKWGISCLLRDRGARRESEEVARRVLRDIGVLFWRTLPENSVGPYSEASVLLPGDGPNQGHISIAIG